MGHSTCKNIIVIFFKNTHIMLNANVDGPIDRLGGVVPLRIDDRLEPLPENRPSLSEPPDAEIEISPSKVGMVDLYIATGKMELGVHAGRKHRLTAWSVRLWLTGSVYHFFIFARRKKHAVAGARKALPRYISGFSYRYPAYCMSDVSLC